MESDCPDSWENMTKTNLVQEEEFDVKLVEESEKVTLFTGNNKQIIQAFGMKGEKHWKLN